MDFNGNQWLLNAEILKRVKPKEAAEIQKDTDGKRFKRVIQARDTQPVLIPLEFNLVAGQLSPTVVRTPSSIGYDVIITAVIANNADRELNLYRVSNDEPFVHIGEGSNILNLTINELAGMEIQNGGGQLGHYSLTAPIVLKRGERIAFEVYPGVVSQTVNIVLCGYRVITPDELVQAEIDEINYFIELRELPQVKYLKNEVRFDSAVAGGQDRQVITPQNEYPLLIRGIHSTLNFSKISLGMEGRSNWTTSTCPIWALAGQNQEVHRNWNYFQKPIYLPARTSIEMRLVNGIGANLDTQFGNTITLLCETV